jgi:hypothetical protein
VGVWVLMPLRACRLLRGIAGMTCCQTLTGLAAPLWTEPVGVGVKEQSMLIGTPCDLL